MGQKDVISKSILQRILLDMAVYLFQLQRVDCSAALTELLQAPGIVKAGIALAHDLRQLKLVFPFADPVAATPLTNRIAFIPFQVIDDLLPEPDESVLVRFVDRKSVV